MYALSVKQPWAELIARGRKRIEHRSWTTRHRGDLLIVASRTADAEALADEGLTDEAHAYGAAVCVVAITKVTGSDGDFRWHLADPRRVKPLPLRGYAALYKVPDERIEYLSAPRARRKR